jgi:RNA polymerase sigma-70 factor (ECF subfamily)
VQGSRAIPDPDLDRQREVVEAFLAAAREGDFEALAAVLDPDIVLRQDLGGGKTRVLRGLETVAAQAQMYARLDLGYHPALVNGAVGAVATRDGRPFSIGALTVRDGKIVEMDFITDPERLARIDLAMLER